MAGWMTVPRVFNSLNNVPSSNKSLLDLECNSCLASFGNLKMRNFVICLFVWSFLGCTAAGANSTKSDFEMIEQRFADWTEAFNRRDLDGSCALFSKDIRADHQGVPTENWQTMRARFQKLFADKSRQYKYRFKLINVYRSGDLAVGRITWYLTVTKDGKPAFVEETQSMDIFKPNKEGVWEMIDFVSFTEQDKPVPAK
jgi:ketosteroid isomerase-like protein